VPPENPQAIANAILCLFKMSQKERKAMGQNGREYVKTHHDYSVLAKKFLEGF
jgi:glycosyltransferase involved in cell wall biosynthesis